VIQEEGRGGGVELGSGTAAPAAPGQDATRAGAPGAATRLLSARLAPMTRTLTSSPADLLARSRLTVLFSSRSSSTTSPAGPGIRTQSAAPRGRRHAAPSAQLPRPLRPLGHPRGARQRGALPRLAPLQRWPPHEPGQRQPLDAA
jgi:hypothetical protein